MRVSLLLIGLTACWTSNQRPVTSVANKQNSTSAAERPKPLAPTDEIVPQESLYVRLGGSDAILAIVKDWVEEQIARDARINVSFANADIVALETHLSDQLCMLAGGPCSYHGRDMRTAHAGMSITAAQFDACVDDLHRTLDKFMVREQEQAELLGGLEMMRGDIIGP